MKVHPFYLIAIVGLFIITSCKKNNPPAYSDVGMRILNSTPWTFYDCTVDPQGTLSNYPSAKAYNYGQVDIGSFSAYHIFPEIYRYAWFRLTMNNKLYYIRVYDYVGETPLVNGRYSYKITYSAATDNISLELNNE